MGYARDFVGAMESVLPAVAERGVRVIANAGGVNPPACADGRSRGRARSTACRDKVRIGVVTGDDLLPRIDELIAAGHALANMETGEPLSHRARSRALGQRLHRLDADRRSARRRARTSSSPAARPTPRSRWRRCATSSAGAPTTGTSSPPASSPATSSNAARSAPAATASTIGSNIPDLANVGYPDRRGDGRRHVRRRPSIRTPAAASTCRRSPSSSCTRWAIRTAYITPDVVADFTTIHLDADGENRVRVFGIKGRPATDKLKVSIAYRAGFKAVGTLVYSWPDALDEGAARRPRAARAARPTRARSSTRSSPSSSACRATHGPLAGDPPATLPEVQLRVGVRGNDARRRRALHARDRAARAQRPAERHRLRRRPPEGRGDRRLLARARSTRPSCRRTWRCSHESPTPRHRARALRRQGRHRERRRHRAQAASGIRCSQRYVTLERVTRALRAA